MPRSAGSRSRSRASVSTNWQSVRVDVIGQGWAPARRVEADHNVAAQRCASQGERELRHVVQEDRDVRWAVFVQQVSEYRRVGRRLGDDVAPRPFPVLEPQPGPVGVGEGGEEAPNGHGQPAAAKVRPIFSACSVAAPQTNSKRFALVK